jgi:hypothetical protein
VLTAFTDTCDAMLLSAERHQKVPPLELQTLKPSAENTKLCHHIIGTDFMLENRTEIHEEKFHIEIQVKGKGKAHPRAGHEGPDGK